MIQELKNKESQKLEKLNNLFSTIEKRAYNKAKKENKRIVKEISKFHDYELDIVFDFYNNEEEIFHFEHSLKKHFSKNIETNFNDDKNNNDLNHGWLLHILTDQFMIPLNQVLKIDTVLFDVNVSYQYKHLIDKKI